MLLPPIQAIVPHYQSNKKKKSSSLKTRNSQKHIQYPSKIIKARYYTEQRDKISQKIMSFIGLQKIKVLKNYTQICQDNMRKFNQLKQELKNNRIHFQPRNVQAKKLEIDLAPKGNSMKIHIKTQKSTINLSQYRHRNQAQKLSDRVKSSLVTTNNGDIKTRLKRHGEQFQQKSLKIKKYSQMSIRQIIASDAVETIEVKKRLYQDYSKRSYHTRTDA